jgi:hypothetical protein
MAGAVMASPARTVATILIIFILPKSTRDFAASACNLTQLP